MAEWLYRVRWAGPMGLRCSRVMSDAKDVHAFAVAKWREGVPAVVEVTEASWGYYEGNSAQDVEAHAERVDRALRLGEASVT